jgi:hypothetical protein
MRKEALLVKERRAFHLALLNTILSTQAGIPSNADKASKTSILVANGILCRIGATLAREKLAGQKAGAQFEDACATFIARTFPHLQEFRPGTWRMHKASGKRLEIAHYQQYQHLQALEDAAKKNPTLAASLGVDYTITPDIVAYKYPLSDDEINRSQPIVNTEVATLSALRSSANHLPLLHASISCKWTIRSDRAQNSRSEALTLIRNRKGHLPHIMVITGEPLPSRIVSLALGTGDIDCVYHFALHELIDAVAELKQSEATDMLSTMIDGRRLKDISDLPLDLAV